MPRTVLLEHVLSDGSAHFDWMCEPVRGEEADERCLVTFRVHQRMDAPDAPPFDAHSLGLHRRLYLHYEGSLSGGRGDVRRVAAGECLVDMSTAEGFGVVVDFGHGPRRWLGERLEDDRWRFKVGNPESEGGGE